MGILKTFTLPEDSRWTKKTKREACRMVAFDENNLIPILFISKENYYKLPGGGIDKNESKIEALQREMLEETGCEIEITKEVGIVIEENSMWEQRSYCYIGKITKKGNNNFTTEEIERGFQLKWVSAEDALSLIKQCKPLSLGGERIQQRDSFILETINKMLFS